ncbi:MAG: Crp/Fnr family transcriptional regulator [Peptostreptococcales bacterium]
MDYMQLMEASTLLKGLSKEQISDYIQLKKFKIVTYKKNSVIHLEGDHCTKLEIILSGKIVIERIEESGDLLIIKESYQGNILGGNLIFSNFPYYPMTVTTQKPSMLLEINKELLIDLCCNNKSFLLSYLQFISDNTLVLSDKIKYYVNRTIREGLINFLKYENAKQETLRIKLHITKKALAEKIGVQRTSLSRELQKMKKEGLIDFDASSITILNEAILK